MTAELVLYDNPTSSNALKARFLLAELDLPYRRERVSLRHPRPDWYVTIQPSGTVPLLEDGDVRVGESNAILRYLAAREGRDDLYGADAAERARVDWALDLWSTQVRGHLFGLEAVALFFEGDHDSGGGRVEDADPAAVAERTPAAERALELFERFVSDDGTVLGRFTIADCAVAPVLWRTRRLPLDFAAFPRLARIREQVCARDAFTRAEPVA